MKTSEYLRILVGAAVICVAGTATGVGLNFNLLVESTRKAAEGVVEERFKDIKLISIEEAKALFDAGKTVFLDARDASDYESGHIKGAVNLPFEDFAMKFPEVSKILKSGDSIVTYCSGADCELSKSLGEKLIHMGYKNTVVFSGGWPQWVKAGYPVEKGR